MSDQIKVLKAKEEKTLNEQGKRTSRVLLTLEYNGGKYRMVFSDRDLNNKNSRRWIVFLDVLKVTEDGCCNDDNVFYYNSIDIEKDPISEIEEGYRDVCIDILLSKELKEFFTAEQIISLVHVIRP